LHDLFKRGTFAGNGIIFFNLNKSFLRRINMSTQLFLGFTAGIYLTTGSVPQNLLVLNGVSAFFEFMLSYPYYYLAMYVTLGAVGSYHLLKTIDTNIKKKTKIKVS
jgi:hypothetical protein